MLSPCMHWRIPGTESWRTKFSFPIDSLMELLGAGVAIGLLSGNANPPTLYSLITTISLERPGCLKVRALVTGEETTIPLYEGSLIISAR
jgi:hypothetical protein